MGYFSFLTTDSKKSIWNEGVSESNFRETVYMRDQKNNVWVEPSYEGYGVFGGKDVFELIAEMNGYKPDRDLGLNLLYSKGRNELLTPTFSFNKDFKWRGAKLMDCPYQGSFIGDYIKDRYQI